MMIHVAARNEEYAQKFLENNPEAVGVILHRNNNSLFKLLQCIIDEGDEYALFVHDDVFLPSNINRYVSNLIKSLNIEWPNWGVCGNAGIVAPTLTGGSRVCRYLFDPHGGASLGGYILPAETIDGNTILINCRALREANLLLPNFEGFQFYDISLSIETLALGLGVLIAPDLACYHNSRGNQLEFDRAFGSDVLIEYLSSRISNQYVVSLNGILKLPYTFKREGQFDISTTAVKNASVGRPAAKIAFVIRSRFRDAQLLQRSANSTLAFAATAENQSIKTYVVTESSCSDAVRYLPDGVSVISASIDTRRFSVRKALNSIEEDFVLFLNDDSWVFPDEARYISDLLTCLPTSAHLVVETQHFSETSLVLEEADDGRASAVRPLTRSVSKDWPLNFTGGNYVPLCGAFYGRQILLQQPIETYDKFKCFENYAISIFAILNVKSIFFSTPRLVSGMSTGIGSEIDENAVNSRDEREVNQSRAELAHYICANTLNNVAFSIGEAFGTRVLGNQQEYTVGLRDSNLSWLDRKSLAFSRFIHGIFVFLSQPSHYHDNFKSFVLAVRSSGLRGAVRSIADMRDFSRRTKKKNQGSIQDSK